MKKVLSFLIIIPLAFPQLVSAHLAGQPPFFLVNGVYSNLYPVPLTSLSDFPLPQDLAPGFYLVNQPIVFGFDISRLPAPPDVVKKTQFTWDFGDGGRGQGLDLTHTYTKPGSYILSIDAFDGTTPTPQLLESALVNVLPDKNYQLPKAVIKINGRTSSDPLTDVLNFPLGQNLHFDASSSIQGTSQIVSYFWDFGDQRSSNQQEVDHYYPPDLTQVFPVLRIKDANGFFADSFIEIENQKNATNTLPINNSSVASQPSRTNPPFLLIGISSAIILGVIYLLKRNKKKRR